MSTLKKLYKTWFETQENKWKTGLVGMIFITVILALVFNHEANAIQVIDEETLKQLTEQMSVGGRITDWSEFSVTNIILDSIEGHSNENSEDDYYIEITHPNVLEVTATLTWQDEPDNGARYSNEPDEFSISITPPNGTGVTSDTQSNGRVSVEISFIPQNDPYFNGTGEYIITVQCHICGDQTLRRPSIGFFDVDDTGNDWTLEIGYTYYREAT